MLTPWYVTGFCDGEAAFTYSRSGRTFGLYFALKQKGDNRQILENVQAYFQHVGNIYAHKGKESPKNSNFSHPAAYYRVSKIDELKVITEHFDQYPLQSKKKLEVYQVWRQMVTHKLENYRDTDYNTLQALAEKLSHLNTPSRAFSRPAISVRAGSR